MMQFNFTDGSYFLIPTNDEVFKYPEDTGEYLDGHFFIVYKFGSSATPNFTKTDLDGHTWTWNGSTLTLPDFANPSSNRTITINNGSMSMYTSVDNHGINHLHGYSGQALFSWFYNPTSSTPYSTNTFYGCNGYAINYDTSEVMSMEAFTSMAGARAGNITNFIPSMNKLHLVSMKVRAQVIRAGGEAPQILVSSVLSSFPESIGSYAPDNDPYADGGQADSYGGNGVFDNSSTNIDFPTLPSISASDAGFITLFNPTLAQMKSLQNYLWGDLFDIDTFKKVLSNPMDVILGLSIVPFDVPSGSAREIMIGNLGSGVTANVATSQFLSFDMGTLTIQSGVGDSYLDYSPYTKASIFLPYIGWQDLDIDEIMNKTLSLKYYCDILSGGCVAMLKCGGSVLYTFSGQCSLNIPLTSIDYTSTISSALSAVQHVAGAIGGFMGSGGSPVGKGLGIAGSVVNGVAGLGSDVMNAKPQYQRSGSVGGASGLLSPQTPYVELTRPSIQRPKFQDTFVGYPSYVYKKVSQLVGTGFNAFSEIILENIGLTADEMQELEEIMKGGVVL